MLFGFQPFATKDSKIFKRLEELVVDRFVGDEGEKLLKYVLWLNGPETETPMVGNKQCEGKDLVVFASRLFVAELFLRYDSFETESGTSALGMLSFVFLGCYNVRPIGLFILRFFEEMLRRFIVIFGPKSSQA
ncbi:hypothetical protein F0562_035953 [Nyssa sinensis]|uniref:Uncharacterized protein n=1 Tax=Nyssa sinensis TaxID=561372 RepID=A0A5J5AEH4_9ASTE|nr:hypothetical protein F0562_035953 [Nyssa sinensis]